MMRKLKKERFGASLVSGKIEISDCRGLFVTLKK